MRKTSRPLTVVALLLGLFLAAMEMTVVSTAMPTVVAELGGLALYAWAFAGYMLTATVTVPIWGKLADLRGRKPVLLAGLALFLAGSSACGWAGSMTALIAWRAVQGLGAGALQPITFTIVGDLFDVHERGRMQGLFGAVWGLAGLVGPLVGGAIVHTVGWRWIFWINLPFGIASGIVLVAAYHERPERHEHRLDVGGAVLLACAVVAALAAARSRAAPAPRPVREPRHLRLVGRGRAHGRRDDDDGDLRPALGPERAGRAADLGGRRDRADGARVAGGERDLRAPRAPSRLPPPHVHRLRHDRDRGGGARAHAPAGRVAAGRAGRG